MAVVVYRQFTCMVHGQLKNKRILLPACTYNIIQSTYEIKDKWFTGYEKLETSDDRQ